MLRLRTARLAGQTRRAVGQRHRCLVERLEQRDLLAAGDPDASYGDNGQTITEFHDSRYWSNIARATVVQSDGRVIVAGGTTIARYESDGSLDASFGSAGRVLFPHDVRAVTVQADGKVVVAGGTDLESSVDLLISRFNSDGQLDNGWGSDGIVNIDLGTDDEIAYSLLIDAAGRVIVGGKSAANLALVRLQTDGTLDQSFDGERKLAIKFSDNHRVQSLALQPNGRLIAVGGYGLDNDGRDHSMFAMRVNTNGSVDASFADDGIAYVNTVASLSSEEEAYGVLIQPDNKIVFSGAASATVGERTSTVRLNGDGTLDTSFGENGIAVRNHGSRVLGGGPMLLADGSFVITSEREVLRYSSTGILDSRFGSGGVLDIGGTIYSARLQADGKFLIGGTFLGEFGLKRFMPDGQLDVSFSLDGMALIPIGPSTDVATDSVLQRDGKLVVVGSSQRGLAVARYASSGQLDTTFAGDGTAVFRLTPLTVEASATSVAVQSDGKIVVTGWVRRFLQTSTDTDMAVMRLNSDGSLDTGFAGVGYRTIDAGVAAEANSLLLLPGGKILIAGTAFNGQATLMRLNRDGSFDTSFGGDGIVSVSTANSVINRLVLQSDGKILAGGFIATNTATYPRGMLLMRFNASGGLDSTFGIGGRVTDYGGAFRNVSDLALTSTGQIIVVGDTRKIPRYGAEVSDMAVRRYNSDGTLDLSFGTIVLPQVEPVPGTEFAEQGINSYGTSVWIQANGKIILSGYGSQRGVLLRLNADGTLDSSFAGDGKLSLGSPDGPISIADVLQQSNGRILAVGSKRAPTRDGSESDFVVYRLQERLEPTESTSVRLNADGNIEVADLWFRDDQFLLTGTDSSVVITDLSPDSHSGFRVIDLPGVLGHGTKQISIPLSLLESTRKPLVISGLFGNDTLTADASFYAHTYGFVFRAGQGVDSFRLNNYSSLVMWIMATVNSGSTRSQSRVPLNFTGVERLYGGFEIDTFSLKFQGAPEVLMIDGGGDRSDVVELRADADMRFEGPRLLVTSPDGSISQAFSLSRIDRVKLTGGASNNVIDATGYQGSVELRGGDGDDRLVGSGVLLPGAASSVIYGNNGNDRIYGSRSNDILYGGSGNDFIVSTPDINGDDLPDFIDGGDGDDILLGSRRNDLLSGGAGEDFLYGGLFLRPFFDSIKTEIIISVWTSTEPYAERVRKLSVVGVGPGRSIKLDSSQQILDGIVDTYIGGLGLDWFFIEPNESGTLSVGGIRDYEVGEVVGP